ncbi:LOW QUALITY PROTEIN: E3 ubiquitin-protein ligase TRIM15-like [Lycaon pictus]
MDLPLDGRDSGLGSTAATLAPLQLPAVQADCRYQQAQGWRVCRRPLRDAVIALCGHALCWPCLLLPSQMGAQPSCEVLLCPCCKNQEGPKTPMVPVPLGLLGDTYYEEHGEKIYFFCETDTLLCVLFWEGPDHQGHTKGVLDAAIQPTQIDGKKRQVAAMSEMLRQELVEQQDVLVAQLRELELQICQERDEYISEVSEEVTRLRAKAKELEKCQQPASALLQCSAWSDTPRYETKTFVSPEFISSDLIKKIRDLHRKVLLLPEMLRTFSENLAHHLETDSDFIYLRVRRHKEGDGQRQREKQTPC